MKKITASSGRGASNAVRGHQGGAAPGRGKPRDSGSLYRVIFEQARDSILLLELSRPGMPVIRDANPAALSLHGYTRDELIGKPVTVLGASLGRGRLARLNGGGSVVFEVRQKRGDGTLLVTEVTARNVELGAVLYGVLIERDITWRQRLEEEGRLVSERIMLAREAEKKLLAASLHDAIGAMQVGLSASLLLIEEELRRGEKRRAFAKIEQARKLLKKVTSGVKRACIESWPPALEVSGLDAVLRELVSGFAGRSKISVLADIRLPQNARASASPLDIVLYRLAQEALNNVEKHSGSKKIDFSVGSENGWLTLSVRDYGRGFDMAKARRKKNSLGLKIMAEAAGSAGGYFSIYSRPGGGALIKAELPIGPKPGQAL